MLSVKLDWRLDLSCPPPCNGVDIGSLTDCGKTWKSALKRSKGAASATPPIISIRPTAQLEAVPFESFGATRGSPSLLELFFHFERRPKTIHSFDVSLSAVSSTVLRIGVNGVKIESYAQVSHRPIRKQESVDLPAGIETRRRGWSMPCRMSSFRLAMAHG